MARITIDGILYDIEAKDGAALAKEIADTLAAGSTCTYEASRFGGPRPVEGHLVISPGQSFFITG
ncbi:hypothetical protein [Sinomonas susongensis]|uniref:hypothetical protein n=1 Tax=Sinomonas susongensis TaxID=1324851 RepID=UPI001107C95D|nr:hypothetical protein [Sinomonas susongensis]